MFSSFPPAFVTGILFLSSLALLAGISGLVFGSKYISRSITVIAKEAGVPVFIIALFLVAFSTSIPELTVGITSALKGIPTLSYGDIYGSNIFNLTFIAPIVLLIAGKIVHVDSLIVKREQLVIYAISSLPIFMMAFTGQFSRLDGIILLSCFFAYFFWLIRNNRIETPSDLLVSAETSEVKKERNILGRFTASCWNIRKELLAFAFGALFLVGGAQLVVYGAVNLAKEMNVPLFFIGILLISVGTSLPELSFGIRSALEGRPENSMGDVIGSSAVNSCFILGVGAVICPISVAPIWENIKFPAFFMVFVFGLLFILSYSKKGLTRRSALVLLATYFIFLFLQIKYVGIDM